MFSSAAANGQPDMYVTALDVFNRRAYFEPHQDGERSAHEDNRAAVAPTPSREGGEPQQRSTRHCSPPKENSLNFPEPRNDDAVCKLKLFSSSQTYDVANSVKDVLNDTLGEKCMAEIYVSHNLLAEKRQLFFNTLFTHTDDLCTALPCRFSIEDVDTLFSGDGQCEKDGCSLYQHRVAALERLRETLDC